LLVERFDDALTKTSKELGIGNAAACALGFAILWIREN
jgi:hypothetical protein